MHKLYLAVAITNVGNVFNMAALLSSENVKLKMYFKTLWFYHAKNNYRIVTISSYTFAMQAMRQEAKKIIANEINKCIMFSFISNVNIIFLK